ncbi:hypothetical protein N7508_008503, partial [Penicillium antarcticum]
YSRTYATSIMSSAATSTSSVSTDGITTLAMTTIFTPPASCSSSWTFEPSGANNIASGLLLQNAAASDNADPNCFPSGYTHFGRQMASIAFSPGYCPEGYTTANMVIHNPVTTAQCCPSNFEYLTMSMGEDSTYAGCTSMFPSSSSTIVTVRQVSDESTQVSGPITMWAQPLQIQVEATDSSLFTTATSTSASAASSSTATTSSTSSPASTSDASSSSSSSSGLSQSASIGIGVGVGVGGALIIAALAFWFFRRRKAQKETPKGMQPSYQRSAHPEASELGGSSQQTAPESVGTFTRSTNPSELAADQGPKPVHELYG